MTRRRWLSIAGLVIAAVAAYLLRDAIHEAVIIPLAYLWWMLGLYYHAIPQLVVWGVLIFFVFTSTLRNILAPGSFRMPMRTRTVSEQGPVEKLSILLEKTERGNYYKWSLANRLGMIAREILDQRGVVHPKKRYTRMTVQGLNLPKEVETYLDSGLNGSFAYYSRSIWWKWIPQSTPLDVNPKKIVECLEVEMEMIYDRDR